MLSNKVIITIWLANMKFISHRWDKIYSVRSIKSLTRFKPSDLDFSHLQCDGCHWWSRTCLPFQSTRVLFEFIWLRTMCAIAITCRCHCLSVRPSSLTIFQNSSPLTLLYQLEPNLVWMFFGVSCSELMRGFFIRRKIWPPLLKI